jgi:hypothetical protein
MFLKKEAVQTQLPLHLSLVAARGVEPLSEGRPAKASTSVASDLDSHKGLPETGYFMLAQL